MSRLGPIVLLAILLLLPACGRQARLEEERQRAEAARAAERAKQRAEEEHKKKEGERKKAEEERKKEEAMAPIFAVEPEEDFGAIDRVPRIALGFRESDQRFGIVLPREADPKRPGRRKRLTYDEQGKTNNTCIIIDDFESLYGRAPGTWVRDRKGPIQGREVVPGRKWVSKWHFPQNVEVTQTVMIIGNDTTKKTDTCLIHYLVENKDQRRHKVGVRIMLDTFIGANDGVPLVIPSCDGLMDTKIDIINTSLIPKFIQALENPGLNNPGTVAMMGLKLPANLRLNPNDPQLEDVVRLVICRWPGAGQLPGGGEVKWEFVHPRGGAARFWNMNDKSKGEDDSCVTVYWPYATMFPKQKRAMAITYGLGQITTIGKNASLALTTGGWPQPGKEITVTAWLKNARANQRVALALPVGMTFAKGFKPQAITGKAERRGLSQVSWHVHIDPKAKLGVYTLKATSGGQAANAEVHVRRTFNGLFKIN